MMLIAFSLKTIIVYGNFINLFSDGHLLIVILILCCYCFHQFSFKVIIYLQYSLQIKINLIINP